MTRFVKLLIFPFLFAALIFYFNQKITLSILQKNAKQIKEINVFNKLKSGNIIIKNKHIFNKDTVYVINLWGARCKPCIKEMPELNKLYDKHKQKPVRFIALSRYNDDSIKFSKLNIDFKFNKYYHEGNLFDYFQNLNLSKNKVIPVTILINKEGTIEYYLKGANENNIKFLDNYLSNI